MRRVPSSRRMTSSPIASARARARPQAIRSPPAVPVVRGTARTTVGSGAESCIGDLRCERQSGETVRLLTPAVGEPKRAADKRVGDPLAERAGLLERTTDTVVVEG